MPCLHFAEGEAGTLHGLTLIAGQRCRFPRALMKLSASRPWPFVNGFLWATCTFFFNSSSVMIEVYVGIGLDWFVFGKKTDKTEWKGEQKKKLKSFEFNSASRSIYRFIAQFYWFSQCFNGLLITLLFLKEIWSFFCLLVGFCDLLFGFLDFGILKSWISFEWKIVVYPNQIGSNFTEKRKTKWWPFWHDANSVIILMKLLMNIR